MSFIKELFAFMAARKKFWLMPIFVTLILIGGLLVAAKTIPALQGIYMMF